MLRVTIYTTNHAAAGTAHAGPHRRTLCPSFRTARTRSRSCRSQSSQSEASVQAPLAAPCPAPHPFSGGQLAPQCFSFFGGYVPKLLLEVQPHAASLFVHLPAPVILGRFFRGNPLRNVCWWLLEVNSAPFAFSLESANVPKAQCLPRLPCHMFLPAIVHFFFRRFGRGLLSSPELPTSAWRSRRFSSA